MTRLTIIISKLLSLAWQRHTVKFPIADLKEDARPQRPVKVH